MRVFLAGATGAIGKALVPLLLADGHHVVGATRATEKAAALKKQGVEPVIVDALDADAVREAVVKARAEAVINQLTSIPQRIVPRKIGRDFAVNDRLRREGTANLVRAAQAAGAARVVAQSIAFAYAQGPTGTVHGESDPLLDEHDAPKAFVRSALALRELESTVLAADGVVLRYGFFYGPGTAIAPAGSTCEDVARRRIPIVGRGKGAWSFIHIADAASATVKALASDTAGVYNIVDDKAAHVAQWLNELADALGARAPQRVPALLARPVAGGYGMHLMTRVQGASNASAKRNLGWTPAFPDWREGFREALGGG